ncbi:hypothetical protein CC86DRAFT_8322 [Ophiobolus disseminans]|uniref:Uncharacterized protein n=1 Tax=Ophiobolus disseminans TaxID=1469910 RepID=A0A6A7AKV0_9PLEO|nr:hypothetical protein CC86DRAFT_8322 [Ophiobolus disseminans]
MLKLPSSFTRHHAIGSKRDEPLWSHLVFFELSNRPLECWSTLIISLVIVSTERALRLRLSLPVPRTTFSFRNRPGTITRRLVSSILKETNATHAFWFTNLWKTPSRTSSQAGNHFMVQVLPS